jgi:hypothetical protein
MTAQTLDLSKLEGFHLVRGGGNVREKHEACAMQAINWATTGETSDMPECVHPILARFVQREQDRPEVDEATRWRYVREAGPLLVGTSSWPTTVAALVVSRAGRTVAGLVEALSTANPHGADLADANLSGAYLYGASLAGTDLTGAYLTRAYLAEADLSRVDLTRAILSRADLTGADLTGAILTRADLYGANLTDTNLAGTNLYWANLFGADLFGADLFGCRWSSSTVWPEGFTPPVSA